MNWLSNRKNTRAASDIYSGKVSSGQYSVIGDGETRDIGLCSPGGYSWKPGINESVIVVRTGQEGETRSIVGRDNVPMEEISPGEVYIKSSGGAYIYLKNNGDVVINGHVFTEEEEE